LNYALKDPHCPKKVAEGISKCKYAIKIIKLQEAGRLAEFEKLTTQLYSRYIKVLTELN